MDARGRISQMDARGRMSQMDARGTECHAEWIHACTYFRKQTVLLLCLPRRMNSSVETTFIVQELCSDSQSRLPS